MIRNFRRVLNKGTFSFLCSKLKVAWWKDWAQDDPFLWGWQTRGPSCCISSSPGSPFSGSIWRWNLLVLLRCTRACAYGNAGLLVMVGGILSPPCSLKDYHRLRSWSHFSGCWESEENQDGFSVIAILESKDDVNSYLAMSRRFPSWDLQGLVMLNFQKRSPSPKKKSSKWLSVA